jgi:hypothetical protein
MHFQKNPYVAFGASYGFQLPRMDFQFGLGKIVMFLLITPTHSTPFFTCCTFCWVIYVGAKKGVMLRHDKYILGNYWIKDAKGHLWVWNMKLVIWDMMAPFHILHNNHKPCLQPWVLRMFHHPNPRYR